ncbi:hypothetical protein AC529_00595 [Thermobifida cellulosilytica TB100]|uniref:Uncharacterized protein n=1 Tax=Thermobifida cellulosilytica TB100 TaxID=665004 RepID=A0A147KMP7_THECS|nr:hypothetical protein AC529_00595 [Thermobifida cellulosilytica TB100]
MRAQDEEAELAAHPLVTGGEVLAEAFDRLFDRVGLGQRTGGYGNGRPEAFQMRGEFFPDPIEGGRPGWGQSSRVGKHTAAQPFVERMERFRE